MPTDLPLHILDTITTAFRESGDLLEKNPDDLRYELEFQNDSVLEDNPEAEAVTLLQLLHASTARMNADPQDPAQRHIHEMIECAFIEQEALGVVATLWPDTNIPTFTAVHIPLLEAAVRDHLSEHGLSVLDTLLERVRTPVTVKPPPDTLPDYRDSPLLHFGGDVAFRGDPPSAEGFAQALACLETLTARFVEQEQWANLPEAWWTTLGDDWWERTAARITRQLDDANAEHRTDPAHRAVTFDHLKAFSQRRILAMEDTGWHLTHVYRIALTFDRLLTHALNADASLQQRMHQATEPTERAL